MTSELEKRIQNHCLTYDDLVVGESYCGNPKWNPEVLDYILETGYSAFKLWKDNQVDELNNLRCFKEHFYGTVRARKRRRAK